MCKVAEKNWLRIILKSMRIGIILASQPESLQKLPADREIVEPSEIHVGDGSCRSVASRSDSAECTGAFLQLNRMHFFCTVRHNLCLSECFQEHRCH
jgi:hypothetical protein